MFCGGGKAGGGGGRGGVAFIKPGIDTKIEDEILNYDTCMIVHMIPTLPCSWCQ